MADLGATVNGPAAEWLSARRPELNARFARARRRFPRLQAEAVLTTLAEHLPPLAGSEPGSAALLSAIYDLVLLHVARDAFAAQPGLVTLFRAFRAPALRTHLLAQPTRLPAELSNAVEALGTRGPAFSERIASLATAVDDPDQLRAAGAVLAWRLGEARLREVALAEAQRLPARAVLMALHLLDWPPEAATLAVAALRGDAWTWPRQRVGDQAVAAAAQRRPEERDALATILAAGPWASEHWEVVGTVGDFQGFGGNFVEPPHILDAGDRHQLYVRSGEQDFVVWADLYGWVCRPCPPTGCAVASVKGQKRSLAQRLFTVSERGLAADGSFVIGKDRITVPALVGSNAFTLQPALLAATRDDSYRIRIAVPRRPPS